MTEIIRVELPLRSPSELLDNFKTIGDLKNAFPDLNFVKYIYIDPTDKKMKGANPPDSLPLVADAYITVTGDVDDVIKFTEKATRSYK